MNYADSARIKAVLTHAGMEYVSDMAQADLIIFDTCSVRQKSEDKIAGKMMEVRKDQKVWMTGCMVQHYLKNAKIRKAKTGSASKLQLGNFVGTVATADPIIVGMHDFESEVKQIKGNDSVIYINQSFNPLRHTYHYQFPNVELFFRIDDTGFLPLLASKLGYNVHIDNNLTNEYSAIIPHTSNQLFSENTKTAYVPISTGCSQFCAYCIVPYARGLENNRPVEDIIKEVEHHLSNGIQEIVLLGQIVNKHPQFVEICKKVLAYDSLKRLRYTSPYPTFFSPELLTLHEQEEKMCPHIHMPLQSGSNAVLKKMFRGYTVSDYQQFVQNIRNLNRPISITSDIIVGFPDESEEDFQQTLEVCKKSRFDMIYIGIYSPRPGTIGAKKYQDNIPTTIKKDRWNRLNEQLRAISSENNQTEIGHIRTAMVTRKLNKAGKGEYFGYTDNMKNIIIRPQAHHNIDVGSMVQVRITGSEAFKLFGDVV